MENLVGWLIQIEDRACRLYEESLKMLAQDDPIYDILETLALDEAMHYHFMKSAMLFLKNKKNIIAEIELDSMTIARVTAPMDKIETALQSKSFNRDEILEAILQNEQSEWNDIFLYVVNTLTTQLPHFKIVGPSLQNHLRVVEQKLALIPDTSNLVSGIKKIKPIWKEQILIVEDSQPIANLLKAVFSKEGRAHCAPNGKIALEMLTNNYYAAIISDINMPVMDGLVFFEQAQKIFPKIAERFIFVSGAISDKTANLIEEKNIDFLHKPFSLYDIRQAVYRIFDRISL